MLAHENPYPPDETVAAIREVTSTMTGTMGDLEPYYGDKATSDEHESPAGAFDFDPDGLAESAEIIKKMDFATERLPDILARLRKYPRLPHPDEIPELLRIHANEPILLETPVTVGDMAAHLLATDDSSHEIGLQMFGDKCVMFAGSEGGVDNPPFDWMQLIEQQADTIAHTHPKNLAGEAYPSPNDLEAAELSLPAHVVLSKRGIMFYPGMNEYMRSGLPRLVEYLARTSFDPSGDVEADYWRLMNSYTQGTLRLQLIPWEELPGDLTLQEAISYAVNLRKQQFDRGDFNPIDT